MGAAVSAGVPYVDIIGFSSAATTLALLALRSGFFRWAAGERWAPLRWALLHSPGEGAPAPRPSPIPADGTT